LYRFIVRVNRRFADTARAYSARAAVPACVSDRFTVIENEMHSAARAWGAYFYMYSERYLLLAAHISLRVRDLHVLVSNREQRVPRRFAPPKREDSGADDGARNKKKRIRGVF
jgi:hypothetical protein